jgi:hypothetical protein
VDEKEEASGSNSYDLRGRLFGSIVFTLVWVFKGDAIISRGQQVLKGKDTALTACFM